MLTHERDDPGMSYRLGYQHAAVELFRHIEGSLDSATREAVRTWIYQDIAGWQRAAVLRSPPTWRLTNLRVLNSNQNTSAER